MNIRYSLFLFGFLVLFGSSFGISQVYGQVSADYGDAPDGEPTGYPNAILVGGIQPAQIGQFPSLYSSDGARILNPGVVSLGPAASSESDALITDSDDDDGVSDLVIILNSIPPPAKMTVDINSQVSGTYYLNVLIDLNMDGKWEGFGVNGEPEWAVQNKIITLGPGQTNPDIEPFAFSNGNRIPDKTWMRIALTDTPVPGSDWDGTGEFNTGEIEDHFVELAFIETQNDEKKILPIVTMECGNPKKYFNGKDTLKFNCNIQVWGGGINLSAISWKLAYVGGGNVAISGIDQCSNNVAPNNRMVDGTCGPPAVGGLLTFKADKTPPNGPIPPTSHWKFSAEAIDPEFQIIDGSLIPGFGISEGFSSFYDTFEDPLIPFVSFSSSEISVNEDYLVTGFDFEPDSEIELYVGDLLIKHTQIKTNSEGSFISAFHVFDLPDAGNNVLVAIDEFGNKAEVGIFVNGKHHCFSHR